MQSALGSFFVRDMFLYLTGLLLKLFPEERYLICSVIDFELSEVFSSTHN